MEKRSLGSESSASRAAVTIPDAGKVTPLPASVGGSRRASALASAPAAVLRLTRAAAASTSCARPRRGAGGRGARWVFDSARVDARSARATRYSPRRRRTRARTRPPRRGASDGSDDLKKNRLQNSPDARATSEPSRMWPPSRCGRRCARAGAMEVSPGIATAGGGRPPRARGIWVCITRSWGGVDVKSILPVVEARFALRRNACSGGAAPPSSGEPTCPRRRRGSSTIAGASDASSVDASPSVDRDSKRARVVAGWLRETMREADRCTSPAPRPQADPGRTTSGSPSGLARVASPAFGLAGRAPDARGASAARGASSPAPAPAPRGGSRVRRRARGAWNFANAHRRRW